MNFSDAMDFDTEEMRNQVEFAAMDEKVDMYYAMAAYEVIDLLNIELTRLRKIEEVGATAAVHICDMGWRPVTEH